MSVETKEAVMEGKVKHWIRISCAAAAVTGASAVLMVAGLLRKDAPLFFWGANRSSCWHIWPRIRSTKSRPSNSTVESTY